MGVSLGACGGPFFISAAAAHDYADIAGLVYGTDFPP
jgi:hypothetical protein